MSRKPSVKPNQDEEKLRGRYGSYSPSLNHNRAVPEDFSNDIDEAPRRSIVLRIIAWTFIVLLLALLLIGFWDARNLSSASNRIFGSGNILNLLSTQGAATDSNGRLNVLLVGYSVDDPGHPAANLTDSIILLSMNRQSNSGYMLSIPRDLYVNIPGFGYGKINEAYKDGGLPLLERVVSDNFQTQINYYALIDYAAVKSTVDALGGININIKSSDQRGLFDPNISPKDGGPLKLSNGPQKVDGQTALNLTRARGDPCGCGQVAYGFAQSDFDRTQSQRQILTAIKDKLNWIVVLIPWKNQQILDALSRNIKTDMPATGFRSVFGTFNGIPSSKLQSISLRDLNGHNYLSSYTTAYGQDALIPSAGIDDYSSIDQAISQLNN